MVSPPVQMNADLSTTARALFVSLSCYRQTESPSYVAKAGPHVKPRSRHNLGSGVTSHFAVSSASAGLLSSRPSCLVLAAALPPPPLPPKLRRACCRDDVVLPNRSRIRLAGRNRQGPPPRRRNVPPPRALDAASAHRCRSTPARDGYARRNNGSTSGQRSAVATDISACSVARVAGGGRARGGRGEQDARAGGGG